VFIRSAAGAIIALSITAGAIAQQGAGAPGERPAVTKAQVLEWMTSIST